MIARAHLGNLQKTDRAKITWIAARNPENLERVRAEFDIPNKTHDYKDILKDPVISMELARKHMDIIFRCYNKAENFK